MDDTIESLFDSGETRIRIDGKDYIYYRTEEKSTVDGDEVTACRLVCGHTNFNAYFLNDEQLFDCDSKTVKDYEEIIYIGKKTGEDDSDVRLRVENLVNTMIQGVVEEYSDKLDSLSVDAQNFINDRVASWRERLLDYMMDLSKGDGVTYEDFRGNIPPM